MADDKTGIYVQSEGTTKWYTHHKETITAGHNLSGTLGADEKFVAGTQASGTAGVRVDIMAGLRTMLNLSMELQVGVSRTSMHAMRTKVSGSDNELSALFNDLNTAESRISTLQNALTPSLTYVTAIHTALAGAIDTVDGLQNHVSSEIIQALGTSINAISAATMTAAEQVSVVANHHCFRTHSTTLCQAEARARIHRIEIPGLVNLV